MAKKKVIVKKIWDSEELIQGLKAKVTSIKEIKNTGQGGNYDSENLVISFTNTKDNLFVFGFVYPNSEAITTPSKTHVDLVELSDGQDSRGGLNSSDFNLAKKYIEVRQYLLDNGFDVVCSMNEYW